MKRFLLCMLLCACGKQGEQGKPGNEGPTGPAGDVGPAGPRGAVGPGGASINYQVKCTPTWTINNVVFRVNYEQVWNQANDTFIIVSISNSAQEVGAARIIPASQQPTETSNSQAWQNLITLEWDISGAPSNGKFTFGWNRYATGKPFYASYNDPVGQVSATQTWTVDDNVCGWLDPS
jgi:hypothetical protein